MSRLPGLTVTIAALASASFAFAETLPPGEAELAKAIAGRVAGKPETCLELHSVRSSRIVARTAIIFDQGGTLFVNRPTAGAEVLSDLNALLTNSPTGELCRGDAVETLHTSTGVHMGSVFLGPFIPYRKPEARGNSDR